MGPAELGAKFHLNRSARPKMQFVTAGSGGEIRDQPLRLEIIQPTKPRFHRCAEPRQRAGNQVENCRGRKYGTGSGQVNQRRGPLRSGP